MQLPRTLLSPALVLPLALLFALLTSTSRAVPSPMSGETDPVAGLTIAVADFTGSDKELGRFIAETLLTDLAQSQQLHLVERTEIRQALTELKLQSTGLVEPQQVKQLGKLVGADRLIVGSFFLREDQVLINARLLDVRSGRVAPGGSANVSGSRADLLALTHRLARQFHKRVTGTDLALDGEDAVEPAPSGPEPASMVIPTRKEEVVEPAPQKGFLPPRARPNGIVTERDLTTLVSKLAQQTSSQTDNPVTVMRSNAPASRMRVLAAFVKLFVAPENLRMYADGTSEMPPDVAQVPTWGRPYVAAAMQHDWWPVDRPLRAREDATWLFVSTLLERMPIENNAPASSGIGVDAKGDPDSFTGLVVDVGGMRLERDMNFRILDEDGQVVYPDSKHLPTYYYLLDNGMASYCGSIRETAHRAGDNPLVVRAIGIGGPGHDDVIVSNATADRIRDANRRGRFLWRWSVCVVCRSSARSYTHSGEFPGY